MNGKAWIVGGVGVALVAGTMFTAHPHHEAHRLLKPALGSTITASGGSGWSFGGSGSMAVTLVG